MTWCSSRPTRPTSEDSEDYEFKAGLRLSLPGAPPTPLAEVRELLSLDAGGDSLMDAGARAAMGVSDEETVETAPASSDRLGSITGE